MTHDERVDLAYELAERMLLQYGEDILTIAIYGSVAKGQDQDFSDLEIWVATTETFEKKDVLSACKDVTVEISYVPASQLLKVASAVDALWPLTADSLRSYAVIYDRVGFAKQLEDAALRVGAEDFRRATRERLIRTREALDKLRNAWKRRDHYGIISEAGGVAWGTAVLLGFLNRTYYPGNRRLFEISKTLEIQPKDYARLVDEAGGFTIVDEERVYQAAVELWENVQALLRRQGLEWEDEIAQV